MLPPSLCVRMKPFPAVLSHTSIVSGPVPVIEGVGPKDTYPDPLKLKACPTLPGANATLPLTVPLLPATRSVALPSPAHQLDGWVPHTCPKPVSAAASASSASFLQMKAAIAVIATVRIGTTNSRIRPAKACTQIGRVMTVSPRTDSWCCGTFDPLVPRPCAQ